MAVPFSNTKLRVPQGFQTLLEMLSREILKDQPKNVYEFAADYLDDLVTKREKGQLDPILKQSLLDDRFYNNDSFKTEPPVNGDKENEAAKTIQSAYRGHETRQELNPDDDNEKAAIKIQATYRGFKTRKDLNKKEVLKDKNNKYSNNNNNNNESTLATASLDNNKLKKSVDLNSTDNRNDLVEDYIHNRTNNNSNIIINTPICSMDSNKRDKENESQSLLDRAATKIQSTFRGYKTRKVIKTNSTIHKNDPSTQSSKSLHDNPELAAIKIQSTFRGYKTRKQLKPKLKETSKN